LLSEEHLEEEGRVLLKAMHLSKPCLVRLQLDLSHVYIGKVIRTWESTGLASVLAGKMIDILQERMEDELASTFFVHVARANAEIYNNSQPFGQDVADGFQSRAFDIEEAGRCLAVGRATASVFHLMRVMEAGLMATAKALGVPYAPSWESYLKQIHDKISIKYKRKGIRWKRDEPFFKDFAARLEAVKVAWRNPTMHIERRYTEEEASEVYEAVKMFMRHLATRISEGNDKRKRGRPPSVTQ
jgi:hypothetical protein